MRHRKIVEKESHITYVISYITESMAHHTDVYTIYCTVYLIDAKKKLCSVH